MIHRYCPTCDQDVLPLRDTGLCQWCEQPTLSATTPKSKRLAAWAALQPPPETPEGQIGFKI